MNPNVSRAFVLAPFVVAAAALVAAGCSSSNTDDPKPATVTAAETAEAEFWTTYHGGAYDEVPAALDKMKAVHDADPANTRNTMLLGLGHLWRLSESGRAGAGAGQIAGTEAPQVVAALSEAHMRDPKNTFATGFLGIVLHDQAKRTHDETMKQQGKALIAQAVADVPRVGLFIQFLADRREAVSDPLFGEAVDSMWKNFDLCTGTKLDRNNPDYAPYLSRATTEGDERYCWDTEKSPHNLEGQFLYMGDALVKQGKLDAAKVFYRNTYLVRDKPLFAGQKPWPHQAVVDARLASDLPARAAAYAGADPTKWPDVGNEPFNCTTCHAVTGK